MMELWKHVPEKDRGQVDFKAVVAQVFIPSVWANRVGEMMELWKHVPKKDRGQIDFEAVIAQTIQAGLPPAQKWNEEAFASAARPSGYKKSERSERTHHHVPFY